MRLTQRQCAPTGQYSWWQALPFSCRAHTLYCLLAHTARTAPTPFGLVWAGVYNPCLCLFLETPFLHPPSSCHPVARPCSGRTLTKRINATLAEYLWEATPYARYIVMFRDPVTRYRSAFFYYR